MGSVIVQVQMWILLLPLFLVGPISLVSSQKCTKVAFDGEEYEVIDSVPTEDKCKGDKILRRNGKDFCMKKNPTNQNLQTMSCSEEDCLCGQVNENAAGGRVLLGEETPPHQYPWLTYIRKCLDSEAKKCPFSCSSSIISRRAILTAAHCICEECSPEELKDIHMVALLGEQNSDKWFSKGNKINTKFILHPDWDGDVSNGNDLAILITDKEMTFNTHLQPICLPLVNDERMIVKAITAGWGISDRLGDWLIKEGVRYDTKSFFSYDSELEKVIRDIVDWFPVLKDQLEIKDVEDHKDIVFKKEAIKNADFLKKGIIRSIKQKLGTTKSIMMDERFGQAIEIFNITESIVQLSKESPNVEFLALNKMLPFGSKLIFGVAIRTNMPKHGTVGITECEGNILCSTSEEPEMDGIPHGKGCQGDSGGPLMIKTGNGMEVVGVFSHAKFQPDDPQEWRFLAQCHCDCDHLGNNNWIDVRKYIGWINGVLESNDALPTCTRKK